MKKFFTLIAAVLFAGGLMAATATMRYTGSTTTNMVGNGTNNAELVNLNPAEFTVLSDKDSASNEIGLNKSGDMRLYAHSASGEGCKLMVTCTSTINFIQLNIKQTATFVVLAGETAVTEADGKYVINATSFTIQNKTQGATTQLQLNSIAIDYEGGVSPEPIIDPWAEIFFNAETAAGSFNDSVFTAEGDFKLTCIDTDNAKIKTSSNDASFGTQEELKTYRYRLQTGGKSGSKNSMKLNIPAKGSLRIAVRTGSNSDSTRTLVLSQGTDTLYNRVVKESDAIDVPVTDSTTMKVYPYITVPVNAGEVAVAYPVNSLNFYSFAFMGTVHTPYIDGEEEFTDSVIVTITCTTPESDIYYTTDGTTNPKCDCAAAPEYKKPIVIKETTTIKAAAYTGNDWSAIATKTFVKKEGPKNLGPKTIAEFLEMKNAVDTCILTGVVDSLVNTVYGNFNLIDATGKVYVYGLLNAAGEAKKFAELGVEEGDTLTVKALYNEYNNAPQAKNAIFVSVKNVPLTIPTEAPAAPTLAEENVMGIYCNHYANNNANFGISGWAGAYQTLDLQGTNVGYWTGMTWECIIDPANTDAAHDFSAYQNVHVDFWAPAAAKIKFTAEAVAGGNYKDGVVVNLKKGWNSVDIALADWTGAYDFSNLKCFVFEQYQTPAGESFEGNPFAFANIYFWNAPAVQTITCAEVYSKAKGDAVALNNVVVTFANGANVWVKDATGAMLIYLPSGASVEWQAGDVLSGVAGTVDIYQTLIYEVKPSAEQVAAITVTEGEAPKPEELTYVADADINKVIILKGIMVEGAFAEGTASNININVGNQAIVLRNQFKNAFTFVSGQAYDIIAVVSAYSGAVQLYFIDAFEAQGIENIVLTEKVQKVMVDGVIYIVRDGKMFNAMGAQVR